MRKIQILGAFIAVLAFSALAVASAGATLWLNAKKESLTKATTSHSIGTIILVHEGGSLGNAEIECTGLFHGTVGPGAEDKIEEVLNLSGTEKDLIGNCKDLKGFCLGAVIHPVGLPWDTKLLLHEDGSTWDMILNGGYNVLCSFGVQVECKGNNEQKFLGNGANGAEFLFEGAAGGEQTCSDGGKGTVKDKAAGVALGFTVS